MNDKSESRLSNESSGRLTQLVIATVPLFLVFLWFLYVAWARPNHRLYELDGVDDDATIKEIYRETGAMWIPLLDLLRVFVAFEGAWLLLVAYLWIFVPRRRALIKSYLKDGQEVRGKVEYEEEGCSSWIDNCGLGERMSGKAYGTVEYSMPDSNQEWRVRKQVRVYELFTRENETLLMLPNRPFSVQPKSDVEIDIAATSDRRGQVRLVSFVAILWAVFCFMSALYVYHQMKYIDANIVDDFENVDKAKKWIIWGACIGCPLGALLWIVIRWGFYRDWILNRGKLFERESEGSDGDVYKKASRKRYRSKYKTRSEVSSRDGLEIEDDYEMPSSSYRSMD
mmetsp:Transcript_28809/g.42384  ORF Transcript_28809/g.42384 Transcript_28809/m.42384 type:complete len:340 (-) Transcript_28809:843-1862(-)|eukprot:CAMPEP_0194067390 /NCGR_PEP_ID=MMETSP0009_2-20130614/86531_1 /TAXON_ID=210454 /ORGANISM="Grammatophora oceanica, Strain CCMP 410" /LENGTH=339 /DNA_ID=CAMNT_0038720409 /DNA_START=81 /DNA_END=1100 /DNA_ORIENTATION=-